MARRPIAAALLALALTPAASAAEACVTPQAVDEPPCNPALAQSPWSAAHRGSYAQASSPFPGPAPGERVRYRHTDLSGFLTYAQTDGGTSAAPQDAYGVPIVLDFSEPYPDGGRVVWGSTVATPSNNGVFKLDYATGRVIDFYATQTFGFGSVSGAYNLLDRDGHLIVGRERALEVYGDAVAGERRSRIAKLRALDLTASLCRPDDRLVGLTMTYDGHVAFATELGVVGVVPRHLDAMTAARVRTLSLNGAACGDPAVPRAELEQVSNSIAADEDGGVYVVTSRAQHRVDWDGAELAHAWRAEYETGAGAAGARLGAGSGSTPTLMGTDAGDDRFVVITDGQELMHLVLMWRGEIPAGWEGLPGRDRRIACEVPVTFGDPEAGESLSEQSVLVRGNASFVVNNRHALDQAFGALPPNARPLSVLTGQAPGNAPRGMERIDWDPETRTCRSVWANPGVSIPNGIPTLSTATGLVYGIGQRGGVWGLEGLDVESGEARLFAPSSPAATDNSFFAATEVGPDGSVWTGTFLGVTAFVPEAR